MVNLTASQTEMIRTAQATELGEVKGSDSDLEYLEEIGLVKRYLHQNRGRGPVVATYWFLTKDGEEFAAPNAARLTLDEIIAIASPTLEALPADEAESGYGWIAAHVMDERHAPDMAAQLVLLESWIGTWDRERWLRDYETVKRD